MALNLKVKAPKKATPSRPESAAVQQAARLRELLMEFETIKSQVEVARDELLAIVNEEWNTKIRKGEDVTSVNAPTGDGNRILVVYNERFKTLDRENIEALRASFGEHYPVLVEEVQDITFREGVNMTAIETVIGHEAVSKLRGLIDVKEGVSPKKGVFKETARLFREGKADVGEDALTFLSATVYSPQVRAK